MRRHSLRLILGTAVALVLLGSAVGLAVALEAVSLLPAGAD